MGPVFTIADAHRRCKATRVSELLAQAWVEFATRAWEEHHDRVRAIRAANARVTDHVWRERQARKRQRPPDPLGGGIGKRG